MNYFKVLFQVCAIYLILAINCTGQEFKPITDNNTFPVHFRELVVSLKSMNKAPRIQGGSAVFESDFKFSEQRRVHKAIHALMIYTEESWPELMSNCASEDYSCTIGFGYGAKNYTVGQVCRQLIWNTLFSLHDSCIHFLKDSKVKITELKDPDLLDMTSLKKWLVERKDKSLLEIQVELAGNLKKRISSLDLSDDVKMKIEGYVDEHIKYLEKRGYPELDDRFIPNRETWWFLSQAEANE